MSQELLTDFLIGHKAAKPVSFHMPGHKGRADLYEKYGYGEFLRDIMASDITEIPGADNLHDPSGPIRQLMENYAGLYGVKHTELLVNGGSAGVVASILACVPKGGTLLMARNAHMSAYAAIRLGDIRPVFVMPGEDGKIHAEDVSAAIEWDAMMRDDPVASRKKRGAAAAPERTPISAVLVTSPDYYGVMSDISAIAAAAHRHGIPLIVDQAHGAHLVFFDQHLGTTRSAERQGADLVIDSTHKTLLSFTGTGILNICSDRVSQERVSGYLSMLQTTSPSYPALASLDVNERILRRASREIVETWLKDIRFFHENASRIDGLTVLRGEDIDPTKLSVSIELGDGNVVEGRALDLMLRSANIWPEMFDSNGVLLMTGAGSVRSDYEVALRALYEITCEKKVRNYAVPKTSAPAFSHALPEFAGVPEKSVRIPLYQAAGRAAGAAVTPYPPGIPLICPGEKFTNDLLIKINRMMGAGITLMGVDEEGGVLAGDD
ncbi:MAG: DegT/DnrJ/EryC1/StrS family aminotransferase [Mogibacterium sp.]|nr:DegT/DnrJ/EryC1/StrS family aminotransferase [Mogibacterium sp.]